MATRKRFEVLEKNVYSMRPILENDLSYGYELYELYAPAFSGGDLRYLFTQGATGMVFGEPDPLSEDELRSRISSGHYCRPEDQVPGALCVSPGQYVTCTKSRWENVNLRWFTEVRFQGRFRDLLQDDYPKEETGTMAVALCGAMAINSITPSRRSDRIVMRSVTLAGMSPDGQDETPWIAVEIDLYIHSGLFHPLPFPHDRSSGYVPLDALRKVVEPEGD